jgi:hypothetical protein
MCGGSFRSYKISLPSLYYNLFNICLFMAFLTMQCVNNATYAVKKNEVI